ncbi:MAG: hypothetical protein K2J67_00465 [Lachnospiraceae bacterium]|nr:hypothetical protein [Lachnospiraceae bacterium]
MMDVSQKMSHHGMDDKLWGISGICLQKGVQVLYFREVLDIIIRLVKWCRKEVPYGENCSSDRQ